MWYPGAEDRYVKFLSPRVTYALGSTILKQAGLATLHPGLYQAITRDAFTDSLFIRSRLQLQSKHSPSDVPAVVVSASSSGGRRW